jgi:hypothetical protein
LKTSSVIDEFLISDGVDKLPTLTTTSSIWRAPSPILRLTQDKPGGGAGVLTQVDAGVEHDPSIV